MSDSWIEDMLARGYSKGPVFQSYDEMSVWDKTNTRPHVRSAVGAGYQVCFTDGGQGKDLPSHGFGTPSRPPLGAPLDAVNTEFMDVPF
jgi:hypothetical protein